MGLAEKLSLLLRRGGGGGGGGGGGRRCTVLVLGLDGAGKSSVLGALRAQHQPHPQPAHAAPAHTVAATHDHITSGGVSMSWCDVSGASRHRALWERHYRRADAIVFVVDATDQLRLVVAREELQLCLSHPEVCGRRLPLLVLANKSDAPLAMPAAAIATALGLESVVGKPWHVVAGSAVSGAGLAGGVQWLAAQLREHQHNTH